MKIRKFAKRLALALTAALLAGALMAAASAAEFDLPQAPDWDSLTQDFGTDAWNDDFLAEVRRSADASPNDLPVFYIQLSDGSNSIHASAFYARDPATGADYLLSFFRVGTLIEEMDLSYSLESLNGSGSVEYLGEDGVFSYFRSDDLSGYTPMELGDTASDSVQMCFLLPDESGRPEEIALAPVDLSTWETENQVIFEDTSQENDLFIFNGLPVLSSADGTVIGMMFTGDYLCVVRFGGTECRFAEEYALDTNPERTPEPDSDTEPKGGGSNGSGGAGNSSGSDGQDGPDGPEPEPEDKTKLYLIIGAVAVAALLLYLKKGKKQPQQQAAQGSIPLNSDSVDAGAGFDKTINRTDSAANGQDIYGPTVPTPSEAPRPTAPVHTAPVHSVPAQQTGTVPLALWQLRAVEGPLSGRVYPLSGRMTIGRGSRCDVKFSQDAPGISEMHCQVSVRGDKVFLQDMGSSYGTYYPQNNRLDPRTDYPLHSGEVFTLAQGGASFRLEKMGAVAESGGFIIKDINGKTYKSDASVRITLGRNPGCQGGFGDGEASISGRHCMLYREGGKLYLMDLDSTNGTFFSQQERLKPNVPYRIRKGMAFFLTTPKYTFVVVEE